MASAGLIHVYARCWVRGRGRRSSPGPFQGRSGRLWVRTTGLLPEAPGGWSRTNTGANIDVDQEKKVDLGVLRDADHDGRVQKLPLSTVDGVGLKFEVTP